MILDAYGCELRRAIGFAGGLRMVHIEKRKGHRELSDLVAGHAIETEDTDDLIDCATDKEPDGKP